MGAGASIGNQGFFFGKYFAQYFGFNNTTNTYDIVIDGIKVSKNGTSYPQVGARAAGFLFGSYVANKFINGNIIVKNNELYGRLVSKDTKGMLSGTYAFSECISGNVYIENNLFEITFSNSNSTHGLFRNGFYRCKTDFKFYFRNNILKIPVHANYLTGQRVDTFHGALNYSWDNDHNPNKEVLSYIYNNYIYRQGDPNGNDYMTSDFYTFGTDSKLYDMSVEFNNVYNIGPDLSYGDWSDVSAAVALDSTRTNYENFEFTYDDGTNTRDLSINVILPELSQTTRWLNLNNNTQWLIVDTSVNITESTLFTLYNLFPNNYLSHKYKSISGEDISTNLNIETFEILHNNTIDYSFELLDISSHELKTYKYNNLNNVYSYFNIIIKNGNTNIIDVSNNINYKLKFISDTSLNKLCLYEYNDNSILEKNNDISYAFEYSDSANYIIENSLVKSGIYMNTSENYNYTVSYENSDLILLKSLDNSQYILDTNFIDISNSELLDNEDDYDTYTISMEKYSFDNLLLFTFDNMVIHIQI